MEIKYVFIGVLLFASIFDIEAKKKSKKKLTDVVAGVVTDVIAPGDEAPAEAEEAPAEDEATILAQILEAVQGINAAIANGTAPAGNSTAETESEAVEEKEPETEEEADPETEELAEVELGEAEVGVGLEPEEEED